jgi:hypothetical protein
LAKPDYKSKFEKSVGANLTKRGIKFTYEPFKMCYYLKKRGGFCKNCGSKDVAEKHHYTPDFVLANGIIIEAKGHFTAPMRTKMREVIAANPDKDVRMLFMRDNWLTKKKKHKYSEWCEKNNIKYAFVKVPQEWAKE